MDLPTDTAPTPLSFASYTAYVAHLSSLDPRFTWLSNFFLVSSQCPYASSLHIYDIHPPTITPVAHLAPSHPLPPPSPTATTRLYLLRYETTLTLNRDLLDILSHTLSLSPFFVWQHLDHTRVYGDRSRPALPPFLPSAQRSLELGTRGMLHLSAMMLDDKKTMVMLLRDNAWRTYSSVCPRAGYGLGEITSETAALERRTYGEVFGDELERLTAEEIESAETCKVEYVLPFARILHSHMGSTLSRAEGMALAVDFTMDQTLELLERFFQEFPEVAGAADLQRRSLGRFCEENGWERTKVVRALEEDNEYFLQWAGRIHDRATIVMNRRMSLLALRESKRSITLADSVKKLSQLAFVFLPLTYSASLMGMNVMELGTGSNGLWIYVVIAAVAAIGTGVLWWAFGRVGTWKAEIQAMLWKASRPA